MTKTQISVRVSPDTMAAIDAAAHAAGTSRGHIIDRWLAAQAAVAAATKPGTWREVHDLLQRSNDAVTQVDNGYAPQSQLHAALRLLIRAVSTLNDAGTAPE